MKGQGQAELNHEEAGGKEDIFPKAFIEEAEQSKLCAHSITSAKRVNGAPRFVFFADASFKIDEELYLFPDWSRETKGPFIGTGITYKRPTNDEWVDVAFAATGIPTPTEAEFLATAQAVELAVKELIAFRRRHNGQEPAVYIFTDCAGVAHWLRTCMILQWPPKKKKRFPRIPNRSMRQLATSLCRAAKINMKLELHWVKAHAGVDGNERADRLAGLASELCTEPGFNIRRDERQCTTVRVPITFPPILPSIHFTVLRELRKKRKAEEAFDEMGDDFAPATESLPPRKKA